MKSCALSVRYLRRKPRGVILSLAVLFFACVVLQMASGVRSSVIVGAKNLTPAPIPFAFTINNTGDASDLVINGVCETATGNGQCTLRAAIEEANAHSGADLIDFNIPLSQPNCDAGTGACIINVVGTLQDLSDDVTINGPGADKVTINKVGGFHIFNVTTGGTVSFSGLTISNAVSDHNGGGISNLSTGTLNVTNCILSHNDGISGGGINNWMGIVNVTATIFSHNSGEAGGGVFNGATGTANVIDSSFDSNSVVFGGAIFNAGILNVVSSTMSNNSAGDADDPDGGGGLRNNGSASIVNSTISGNSSFSGGGIVNTGTLNVTNSTIVGNSAGAAGGILVETGGTATIKSTIISNNPPSFRNPDVVGTFISSGFNLIGDVSGSTGFPAATDLIGVDPKLDPAGLQDNGGPTKTIALLPDSPAIDHGTSASLVGSLSTDQRGQGFVRTFNQPAADADDGTDIGAFELQSGITPTPTPTPMPTPTPTPSPSGPCPVGQGYWKTNPGKWPVSSLSIGGKTYTEAQLLTILNTPTGTGKNADASLILADQLIAALLNIANGSDPTPIANTIANAETLLSGVVIPAGVKTSSALGQQMIVNANLLDQYNSNLLTTGCGPTPH